MAYLTQDQVLNQLQGGAQAPNDPTSFNSQAGQGGGGAFVGSASSSPTQGRGGMASPWTNIDSYLKANQNQLGSGIQAVQQKGQEVLQGEQQKLQQAGSQAREGIKKEQSEQVGVDQASRLVNEQNQQGASQIKNYLNQGSASGQFNRPQYQYAQGADAQNWAKVYQDPNAYKQRREEVYGQITGRELTGGQKALQSQLDLSSGQIDPSFEQGKSLWTQYGKSAQDEAAKLESEIKAAEDAYKQNQVGLREYLNKDFGQYSNVEADMNAQNRQQQQAYDNYMSNILQKINQGIAEAQKKGATISKTPEQILKSLQDAGGYTGPGYAPGADYFGQAGQMLNGLSFDAGENYNKAGALQARGEKDLARYNMLADILGQEIIKDHATGRKAKFQPKTMGRTLGGLQG